MLKEKELTGILSLVSRHLYPVRGFTLTFLQARFLENNLSYICNTKNNSLSLGKNNSKIRRTFLFFHQISLEIDISFTQMIS